MTGPASSGGAGAFSPRAILGLLLIGAAAFLAALYFLGAGEPGGGEVGSGAHGAGKGLDGYAAFAELLEAQGYQTQFARSPGHHENPVLLVLTPPSFADVDEINKIIEDHRNWGPTVVVLPKWTSFELPPFVAGAKKGWVALAAARSPDWIDEFGRTRLLSADIKQAAGNSHWQGLGYSGKLPDPKQVQAIDSSEYIPLVRDAAGRQLAGYWNDGGYYPNLAYYGDVDPREDDYADESLWPVVVIAEPDLVNNYGMADRERAQLALSLVDTAMEGEEMPVAFDLTLNGYGLTQNLLTLAFTPPFLAATLCLVLAAIVIGWRALRRFGPPVSSAPVFAFGKRQLAVNVAALIQRSRRLHLLGAPYAAILRTRVTRALGLRPSADPAQAEAEIDRVLASRGIENTSFAENAEALRQARGPHELLRRAYALREIERKLAR